MTLLELFVPDENLGNDLRRRVGNRSLIAGSPSKRAATDREPARARCLPTAEMMRLGDE